MDKIREQLEKPSIAAAVGLVLGLVIGLVVLGWGLFPVEWTDASPEFLRQDLQKDYLSMAIESYSKNMNAELALQRFTDLGKHGEETLAAVQASPGTLSQADITGFTTLVNAGLADTEIKESSPVPVTDKKSVVPLLLGLLVGIAVLVAAGLAFFFIGGGRKLFPAFSLPGAAPELKTQPPAPLEIAPRIEQPPVAQFMTTFMVGDDLYDDSFSIDTPNGEFLGECGIGISDTIGVGDPKRVTAFEVWLFDKNDIQTVTKVLMSHHAFEDPAINQRLESKGEPVLAEPGKRIVLETATLQLEARVVDMNYGQGALPPNSFFDRLTLELAIWPKQGLA